jgi:DNA invertase Pin-like site-specific DNA recombinase
MIYAYLRQRFGQRTIAEQQSVILSFSLGQGLSVDKEVIEYSTKKRPIEEREQFEQFLHGLEEGDAIIVDEIWMFSEQLDELVKVINCLLSRGITLYCASLATTVAPQSPICEIFPMLNTLREEQRSRQKQLGRPKGSRSSSKFDKYQSRIIQMLRESQSVSAIARELDVSRNPIRTTD